MKIEEKLRSNAERSRESIALKAEGYTTHSYITMCVARQGL